MPQQTQQTQQTQQPTGALTTSDIKAALYSRYDDTRKYVTLCEFQPGTCYKNQRQFDFYVLDCYGECDTTAFEIKVSRGDFLRELRNPDKRRLALHLSNYFVFTAPAGLIKPEELPPDCGLMEATRDGEKVRLRMVRQPIHREAGRPTWRLIAAITRTMTVDVLRRYTAERQNLAQEASTARREAERLRWAEHELSIDLDTIAALLTEEQKETIRRRLRRYHFATTEVTA